MSILNYQNLTLTYNEQEILHHIDLMIPKIKLQLLSVKAVVGNQHYLKQQWDC